MFFYTCNDEKKYEFHKTLEITVTLCGNPPPFLPA